jgi:hypothetical protein
VITAVFTLDVTGCNMKIIIGNTGCVAIAIMYIPLRSRRGLNTW